MDIAAHVFATWTRSGARAAQLADRFLDGSIDQLEQYLTAASAASAEQPQSAATLPDTLRIPDAAPVAAQPAHQPDCCATRILRDGSSLGAHPAARPADEANARASLQQLHLSDSRAQLDTVTQRVDTRAAADLSYDEFVRRYMVTNTPVIIRVSPVVVRCSRAGCHVNWQVPDGLLHTHTRTNRVTTPAFCTHRKPAVLPRSG